MKRRAFRSPDGGTISVAPVTLFRHACVWLALPLVLFFFGWFRLWLSAGASMLMSVALWQLLHRDVDARQCLAGMFGPVRMDRSFVLSLIVMLLLLVYCGHGGFVRQSWDWQFRNAVFFDLARHAWPVTYDALGPKLLCYYFVFFLPGALVSKLTDSILAGDIVQLLYAFWGMTIAFSLLCSFLGGRCRWWVIFLMIFFAGADTAMETLISNLTQIGEWWSKPEYIYDYYKSYSLVEQLAQIFNQTIACWIALPLIYCFRKRIDVMVLLCSLLFPFAPLPCVGITLPVAFCVVRYFGRIRILAAAAALLTFFLTGMFYISNSNASSPGATPTLAAYRILILGGIFLLFGIGVWVPLIWRQVRSNAVFWMMTIGVIILPLVAVGDSADLGLRAAIPLMIFIFYVLCGNVSGFEFRGLQSCFAASWFVIFLAVGSYGSGAMLSLIYDGAEGTGFSVSGAKRFEMVGKLDHRAENLYYNNFIAEGESFYVRRLAPARVRYSRREGRRIK